ncbi:hypothetical protein BV25DRAFT_1831850 [Artomyces pyxidatus]|uniref:Uncharacterized protein n=1 Tax=Artomyces pyxidatus TaxID=48021 RepID=A0ACB8SKL7_9AGAM|nr:hypothetical protein BV25DRAFT_1831850 [Artomyces pyxidatus]
MPSRRSTLSSVARLRRSSSARVLTGKAGSDVSRGSDVQPSFNVDDLSKTQIHLSTSSPANGAAPDFPGVVMNESRDVATTVPSAKTNVGVLLRIFHINYRMRAYRERWHDAMRNTARATHLVRETATHCVQNGARSSSDLPGDVRALAETLIRDIETVHATLLRYHGQSKWAQLRLCVVQSDVFKRLDECELAVKSAVEKWNSLLVSLGIDQNAIFPVQAALVSTVA